MKMKDWRLLLSYHGVMCLALKRLDDLKKATVATFLDRWNTELQFSEAVNGSACNQLNVFHKRLERNISELASELLQDTQSGHVPASSILDLMSQALPLFSWQSDCPVCVEVGDGQILGKRICFIFEMVEIVKSI